MKSYSVMISVQRGQWGVDTWIWLLKSTVIMVVIKIMDCWLFNLFPWKHFACAGFEWLTHDTSQIPKYMVFFKRTHGRCIVCTLMGLQYTCLENKRHTYVGKIAIESIFAHPPSIHMTCVYGGVKLSKILLLYDTCHSCKRGVMVTSLEGGWAKMFSYHMGISIFSGSQFLVIKNIYIWVCKF